MITFGSVCSGIEAATVAFDPIGWVAAWLAEIEAFPSAVLAHHYPNTPNLGDMTKIAAAVLAGLVAAPDVLCGGTPCQAFSVAGLRESLGDARGGLTLKFVELANAIDHVRTRRGEPECVILWENVPGVLSTKDNAFGCFLGALVGESAALIPAGGRWTDAGCVYGPKRSVAWRVLDAQYFGLAQRRRRVFVVASARPGFDPAEVLFERDGVRRDSAPSRNAGQDTAGCLAARTDGGGFPGTDEACSGYVQPVAGTLTDSFGRLLGQSGQDADHGHSHLVPETAHTMRGEGFDASEDGTGRGTPLVPVAHVETMPTMMAGGPASTSHNQISGQMRDQYLVPMAFDTTQVTSKTNRSNPQPGDPCHPLAAGAHPPAIAFDSRQDCVSSTELFGALGSSSPQAQAIAFSAKDYGGDATEELAPTLRAMNHANSHANGGGQMAVATRSVAQTITSNYGKQCDNSDTALGPNVAIRAMQVRRLTPMECERLQGFPDSYTAIPWRNKPASDCPDGPRYKALGNSWAVPCAAWIGRRINQQLRGPHQWAPL
jgi:DNA (cytosine-5)-methyltransferase 1